MSAAIALPRASSNELAKLAVMTRVGPLVAAIPATWVARLTLPDAVHTVKAGWPALVELDGVQHVAWDLGVFVLRKPTDGAWVLLRVPFRGAALPIALRTGPCFAVSAAPIVSPLPSRLFTKRTRAIVGAFPAPRRLDVAFGVAIDPAGLWTNEELASSASLLSEGA